MAEDRRSKSLPISLALFGGEKSAETFVTDPQALIANVAVERATVDEGVCGSDGVGPGWMLRGLRDPLLRFGEGWRKIVQGAVVEAEVWGKAVRVWGRGTVSE